MNTFEEKTHVYKKDGIKVPSVTRILSYLLNEGEYMGPKIAGEIGTELHRIAEILLSGHDIKEETLDSRIPLGKYQALKNSIEEIEIDDFEEVLIEEFGIHSSGYGWKSDLILPDRKMIFDWKSGVENKNKDSLQLMAYLQGYLDKYGEDKRSISRWLLFPVYLKEDGTYKIPAYKFDPAAFQRFRYAAEIVSYYKYY